MIIARQWKRGAFTLVETMVSASVGSIIMGALVLAATSFHNIFNATDDYYRATSDQMRVLDYIALDMRRAVSGSVSNATQTLTLTLPDYIDYSQNPPIPRTATVKVSGSAGTVSYGTSLTPPTVLYTVTGSSPNQVITRSYTDSSGALTTITLTATAADFQFSCFDPNNGGSTANFVFGGAGQPASVTAKMTFMPKYNRLNLASSRAGTAASMTMLLRNHK
jgi:Tfp pilus assembly protein PilW